MSLTRIAVGFVLCSLTPGAPVYAADAELLIGSAKRLAAELEETSRPDFPQAAFRVLLIDGDTERLYCAESTLDGFQTADWSSAIDCSAQTRPASFNPAFLATFPLADGVSTIVVGTPTSTGRDTADWVPILVHEHFHQQQQSWSEYASLTLALDLDGGDQTGMWMLNYAFGYDHAENSNRFERLAEAAAAALLARSTEDFPLARDAWRQARRAFVDGLSDADRRYFEFQLWQEGVARYVELEAAIAWDGHPATAESVQSELAHELRNAVLHRDRRVAFYPLGAAEAYLIAADDPDWYADYFDGRLALGSRIAPEAD